MYLLSTLTFSFFYIRFLILSILFLLINIYKLDAIPVILYDEPLYSFTAFNFSHFFHFQHDFGIFSGKEFCLYPFLLGLTYKLFGADLIIGRLLSVSMGIGSLYFFMKTIEKKQLSPKILFLVSCCFIFLNTNFIAFRIIRPEALIIFFLCMMIYFLDKYITLNYKPLDIFLLGLSLSGLAATHLIGFYFSLIPGLFFIFKSIKTKQNSTITFFFLGISPITLLISVNAWHILSIQTQHDQIERLSFLLETFRKNISIFFIDNYIMGIKRLYIVMFECIVLIYSIFFRKSSLITVLALSTMLYLSLGFFSIKNFLRPYFIILPIVSLFIFISILSITQKRNILTTLYIFLSIYFLNHVAGDSYFLIKNNSNESFATIKKELTMYLKDDYPTGGNRKWWFVKPNIHWLKTVEPREFSYYYLHMSSTHPTNIFQEKDTIFYTTELKETKKMNAQLNNVKQYRDTLFRKKYSGYPVIEVWKINSHQKLKIND